MAFARACFVASAVLLFWAHGGYLILLSLLRRLRPSPERPPVADGAAPPLVVAILGVYNEEDAIVSKLDNVLGLDYPPENLRVIVASDGSNDRTNELVARYRSSRVQLVAFPERRGRALVTNDVVAEIEGADWLLFTDADTKMEPSFLHTMLAHLLDPTVAMVDGSIVCANEDASAVARNVGVYWRFESALKQVESDLGVLASTFGACTLMRPAVFRPLAETEDVDFTTPLDALAQGYRIVHEPGAVSFDYAHEDLRAQFRARRRMVAKNLPGTLRKLPALSHRPALVGAIASHKLARWMTPAFLLTTFVSTAVLAKSDRRARAALGVQSMFYAAGAIGAVAAREEKDVPVASTVFSFLVANAGFAAGLIAAAQRQRITTWEPMRGASSNDRR